MDPAVPCGRWHSKEAALEIRVIPVPCISQHFQTVRLLPQKLPSRYEIPSPSAPDQSPSHSKLNFIEVSHAAIAHLTLFYTRLHKIKVAGTTLLLKCLC